MKQLQDYLDGDGKELEYDTELQPFYALPFIEDLYTNTCFSKMLEQSWADELLKNLDSFITCHKQVSKLELYIYICIIQKKYCTKIINNIEFVGFEQFRQYKFQ